MTPNFEIKLYKEGQTTFYAPNLENYRIPQDAPAFYNPAMELNRDCSVLIVQTYQKMRQKRLRVCDPLSGVGIRGLRYANEVIGIDKIIVNDLGKTAFNLIKKNIERNNLESKIEAFNTDANILLEKISVSQNGIDVLDVDPFGSPAPFLDASVNALNDTGLLMLTATDMQVLCGIHKEACIKKYGGAPLRTDYCHEVALRLLIGHLFRIASQLNYSVKPLVSFSKVHYIRTFIELTKISVNDPHESNQLGFISHCFSCDERIIHYDSDSKITDICPNCNNTKIEIGGPLWVGKLQDQDFLNKIIIDIDGFKVNNLKDITKLFVLLHHEANAYPTFYNIHKICKKIKCTAPKMDLIIEKLKGQGFEVNKTHFSPISIKTNARLEQIIKIIRSI